MLYFGLEITALLKESAIDTLCMGLFTLDYEIVWELEVLPGFNVFRDDSLESAMLSSLVFCRHMYAHIDP